jgi:hypothetical protein
MTEKKPGYPAVIWTGSDGCEALANKRTVRAVVAWHGYVPTFEYADGADAMGQSRWKSFEGIPEEFLKAAGKLFCASWDPAPEDA